MPHEPIEHRGWFSRGYLPHFDSPAVIQTVTYRLADSLPAPVLARMRCEVDRLPPSKQDAGLRIRIEAWNDRGHGCCVLRTPDAARLVQDSFLYGDGVRYRLIAWVIMPNHVHVMFEPFDDWPIQNIVGTWRSYTGKRLAPMMPEQSVVFGNERRVWQKGYWDRFIRNEEHFMRALDYIRRNPVKAGLVERPEDWRWGSAWREQRSGDE